MDNLMSVAESAYFPYDASFPDGYQVIEGHLWIEDRYIGHLNAVQVDVFVSGDFLDGGGRAVKQVVESYPKQRSPIYLPKAYEIWDGGLAWRTQNPVVGWRGHVMANYIRLSPWDELSPYD